MSKRSRSSDSLKSTRSLIEGLLGNLGISNKIEQHKIWSIWQDAVGEHIAEHATPSRIRNNVLEIKVVHPVWMQQLQLLKPRLLKQINEHLGDTPIHDLYLRRGQVVKEPTIIAEPPAPLPELNDEEIDSVHQLTSAIKDDEVRTALDQLIQKQRRLDKREQS